MNRHLRKILVSLPLRKTTGGRGILASNAFSLGPLNCKSADFIHLTDFYAHSSWICNDVWMDIFPHFDRPELGLKMALISPRFDCLVDTHFDGKTELALWQWIRISKGKGGKAKLCVYWEHAEFPFPDRPLPDTIRFESLHINYIDHSVLEFLRSNQHIWERNGTNLDLALSGCNNSDDIQPIWDVFVRQIWPIFTTTKLHKLSFADGDYLDCLLRRTSPTILSELNINSINSGTLFPGAISAADFDGPNASTSAGQALAKWLHTPRNDGQPKRLHCCEFSELENPEWLNNFKEIFVRARTSVNYSVHFADFYVPMPIVPFELVNARTNEKLTLERGFYWLLKRCPITAAVQWENDENSDANLNNVFFNLNGFNNSIGQLYSSSEKVFSSPAGPSSDQPNE